MEQQAVVSLCQPSNRESPVLFTREDQRPGVSSMVSFGGSEKDFDYTWSLAASKAEDWVNFTKAVVEWRLKRSLPTVASISGYCSWGDTQSLRRPD